MIDERNGESGGLRIGRGHLKKIYPNAILSIKNPTRPDLELNSGC
jgi:hypothetical protein